MTEAILSKPILNNRLWQNHQTNLWQKALLLIAANALLIISSKIAIALQPVPITLQTFAVFLLAMMGGYRLACASIAIYLVEGLLGLPVFASSTTVGLAALIGPTGGYLLAFIPAAFITGLLLEKGLGKSRSGAFIAACVGNLVIYFFGVAWLSHFISLKSAIALGVLPFILVDASKNLLLALLTPYFWKK